MSQPTNDAVYAGGLLLRALDASRQPPPIRAWFSDEYRVLGGFVGTGLRLLDIGCGTGRHLHHLGNRLSFGLGVDYEASYIRHAQRTDAAHLRFVVGDATAVPVTVRFDRAVCMTNTWGTMTDKAGVLAEMRRLAPDPGSRLISVYAPGSVAARREWYPRLGHEVEGETDEGLVASGGFRSEHFSAERLRHVIGPCEIEAIGDGIGHVVRF